MLFLDHCLKSQIEDDKPTSLCNFDTEPGYCNLFDSESGVCEICPEDTICSDLGLSQEMEAHCRLQCECRLKLSIEYCP